MNMKISLIVKNKYFTAEMLPESEGRGDRKNESKYVFIPNKSKKRMTIYNIHSKRMTNPKKE